MQVGSLFVALGFQVDDKKLKEFNDGIKTATKEIAKLAAGAAAGVWAVNRFISGSVGNAQKLNKFAVDTGYATEELERFYNVARSLDQTVSLDQVINGFSQLAQLAGSAAWGEFSGKALFAGIYDVANASPREVIETLRRNRDGILYGQLGGNRAAFKQILDEMGLGDFMAAIMADEGTYRKYWESALPTSPEQLESLLRISKAMSDFRYNFSVFRREMAVRIEPYWVDMLEKSIPLLNEFTDNMIYLAEVAESAFSSFSPGTQTGIIGFLILLAARAQPVAAALAGIVWGLNQISEIFQDNNINDKSGGFGEFMTTLFGAEAASKIPGVKSSLEKRGLKPSDFQEQHKSFMSYEFPTPLDIPTWLGFAEKDWYKRKEPPMPIPMSNVGNTTVNNNMQIYSDADPLEIGRAAMDRAIEAGINEMRPKSGASILYGGQ